MDFTFGIITDGKNSEFINNLIISIKNLKIPNYEIIVIGGKNIYDSDITHKEFDESIKPNWLNKKKNMVCELAKYENIVLMHDYIYICNDWYEGFLTFGNDFDICVNRIINANGSRFRDYHIYPTNTNYPINTRALLPYTYPSSTRLSKIMYISGSYFVIKKHLALKFPLDNRLSWGQGEDIVFSKKITNNNIIIKCNQYSSIRFQKYKPSEYWEVEMTPDDILYLENLSDDIIDQINTMQLAGMYEHYRNLNLTADDYLNNYKDLNLEM